MRVDEICGIRTNNTLKRDPKDKKLSYSKKARSRLLCEHCLNRRCVYPDGVIGEKSLKKSKFTGGAIIRRMINEEIDDGLYDAYNPLDDSY